MRWPAEWEPHDAVWIGFPGNPVEWPVGLDEAQREVAAFANAIVHDGVGENVLLVCRNNADANKASILVSALVDIVVQSFGDIWLRDTTSIFTVNKRKKIANQFRFNGWGGKFEMNGDQDIGHRLAGALSCSIKSHELVLEGGAIEADGAGNLLTTEQCVLNPNRNDKLTKAKFENTMRVVFGIKSVIWLSEGLKNDHTDGHVDNIARFVAPYTVAIPEADNISDPNRDVFENATRRSVEAGLKVVRIPSVGCYEIGGEIAPASYMNFYVGNKAVFVPQYGTPFDAEAVEEIQNLFPDHRVVGWSSKALLRGGGSFHCISQQIPAFLSP